MVGVQLLWFCVILCYIWLSLAGLKPQLIIWFLKGKNMAALHSWCALTWMHSLPPQLWARKMSQELSIHQEVCSTAELCCWTDFWKMLPAEGVQPSLPMHRALNWKGCVSRIPSSSPQDLISALPGAAGPCPSGAVGNSAVLPLPRPAVEPTVILDPLVIFQSAPYF